VSNLFTNPNKIDDMSKLMGRLERGDLKLRVRALEAERAIARVSSQQVRPRHPPAEPISGSDSL
jgi:hypothetical protein